MINKILMLISLIWLHSCKDQCSHFTYKDKLYFNYKKFMNEKIIEKNDNLELLMSLCSTVREHKKCENQNSIGVLYDDNKEECLYLSNENTKFYYDIEKDTEDKENPNAKYYLKKSNFQGDESVESGLIKFIYKFHCTGENDLSINFKIENEILYVDAHSKILCSYSLDPFNKLFKEYRYILYIILIVVGIILCFFGKKFYKLVLFIIALVFSFLFFIMLLTAILPNINSSKKLLFSSAIILLTGVVGFLLGVLFIKIEKSLVVINSIFVGYIISLVFFFFFFSNVLFLHLIAVGISICLFLLNLKFYGFFQIFNFAVIGGYWIGENSMSFFPQFIKDFTLVKMIIEKVDIKVSVFNYISWVLFFICALLGLIIQIKLYKMKETKKEDIDEFDEYIKNNYNKI